MAKFTLVNAQVLLGGVDISTSVDAVTINYSAAAEDRTAMGDLQKLFLAGLKDWSMDITGPQDFGASPAPDVVIFPLVGTVTTIEVRPVAAARSVTNPAYQSSGALIDSYQPIGGSVGQTAKYKLTIKPAAVLNRLTA